MIPTRPPVKNAKYRLIIILGNPKTRPKTKANLISPPPIASFLVRNVKTSEIITKNKNAPIPQIEFKIKNLKLKINR
jgi:hypothetical protein